MKFNKIMIFLFDKEIKSKGSMIYTSIYLDIIESVKPVIKNAFPNLEVEFMSVACSFLLTIKTTVPRVFLTVI